MTSRRFLAPTLLLPLFLLSLMPRSAAGDDWVGRDKVLHFSASVAVGSAAFATSAWLHESGPARDHALISAGAVVTLGAGKEFLDLARGSEFSYKDLTWDLAGGAVAVGVNLLLWALIR